jgi:hypothetical protein
VDNRLAGGQVGRDAEERPAQILDPALAEDLEQAGRELAPAEDRVSRDHVVVQEVASHERVAHNAGHLDAVEATGDQGREQRAHAGAANHVDRDLKLTQRPHEPDVGEPARAPAAQHKPHAAGGHLA